MSETAEVIRIEDLAQWSPEKRVQTKMGPRFVRSATPTEEFWAAWRGSKEALKAAGISCRKGDFGWEISWWIPLSEAEQAARSASLELSKAEALDLEIPLSDACREIGYDYRPFQKAGIHYGAQRANVLFGDEMGLGKTIQAIGLINLDETIRNVVIFCPATLKLNWRNELRMWMTREFEVTILDGRKPVNGLVTFALSKNIPVRVIIVNYDIAQYWFEELLTGDWDLRVYDEAHYCKNPKTKRAAAVYGIKARRIAAITGTPIPNNVMEGYPIFVDLDPVEFANWKNYRYRYAFSTKNLGELQSRLRSTIMVRRLKRDVLKELPAKQRQVIEMPATAETQAAIDAEMAAARTSADRLAELKAAVELAKVADNQAEYDRAVAALKEGASVAFQEMSLVRHATALAKVPDVIKYVESILEEGHKVLLFGHHRDVLTQLRDHFGNVSLIWGGMTTEEKQAAVDKFQQDETCRVFVGQIQAAGVGITLTAASRVVFAELDWVPGNMSQAEDRAHRIGQEDSVLVQHLVLEGSLDATMARKLVKKQEIIDKALDDEAAKIEAAEPVVAQETVTITRKEADEAPEITEKQRAAIHLGLQMLAGVCDGARELDGAGFNKFDTNIGKSLAAMTRLSNRQCVLGKKLVTKYRRQLPMDVIAEACQK